MNLIQRLRANVDTNVGIVHANMNSMRADAAYSLDDVPTEGRGEDCARWMREQIRENGDFNHSLGRGFWGTLNYINTYMYTYIHIKLHCLQTLCIGGA